MSTNKERLIAALQEPLETTLTRYKTHLDGLKEDQVEENRDLYGGKCHNQRTSRILSLKRFMNLSSIPLLLFS